MDHAGARPGSRCDIVVGADTRLVASRPTLCDNAGSKSTRRYHPQLDLPRIENALRKQRESHPAFLVSTPDGRV